MDVPPIPGAPLMSRASILRSVYGLALVFALLGTTQAQTATKPDAAKAKTKAKTKGKTPDTSKNTADVAKTDDDESSPPNFFGDPKKFTRMGGWGSFGNAMGQFGFAKSTLIMMPPLQAELKLTDKQKEQLREWGETMRKRGETMGKSFREQNGDDPLRGGDNLPMAARVFQFTSMIGQFSGMARENETGVNRILDRSQRQRLNQISLQMEGISALMRPEIIKSLNIDEERQEQIQEILTGTRMAQMTTWVGSMMSMRPPRRPSADSNTNPPDANDAPAEKSRPDPKARADRERAMRKQFQSMRDTTDQFHDRSVREITRLLTKNQRAKFEKLLGPPFDPAQINTLGRPPQRDRPEDTSKDVKN
jgi:hypothetical protein